MKEKRTHRTLLAIFALLSLLALVFASVPAAQAQAGAPWEVLAEINTYRASNGQDPLVENQYLNIAAQNHVNWMVLNGIYDHIGEGGSTYTDRALAVGYGEGKRVIVTENWARGHKLTASGAVYDMWAPSSIHNSQMLTTQYKEFGAGVALSPEGMTVYVVVFGVVIGGSVSVPQPQSTAVPTGPTSTTAPLVIPLITAEPNEDGSVIHVVKYGQTLWSIAEGYGIDFEDLLAQNGLTEESAIYPDQELLIRPADSSTTEDESPTPVKTREAPTPNPSRTPTQRLMDGQVSADTSKMSPTPTETPKAAGSFLIHVFNGNSLTIGISLVVVSVLGLALWFITSSKIK